MSKISAAWVLLCLALQVNAQEQGTAISETIRPYPLGVSYDKTTNLIFPYSIKSVDRGSNSILVQMAEAAENVLQVKAAEKDFPETNLTVITSEGALHSFLLQYRENPGLLNLKVADMGKPVNSVVRFTNLNDNEAAIQDVAQQLAVRKKTRNGPRDKKFEIRMALNGLYIQDDVLFFQIALENKSAIPYDVGQFRLFIQDKTVAKRTASQELEVVPLYIEGNIQRIPAGSRQTIVVAIEKFTIPDKKLLSIALMEENGGRNLGLILKNRHLTKVERLIN